MNISRRALVKGTMAAAAARPGLPLSPQNGQPDVGSNQHFYTQLVEANERSVQRVLQEIGSGQTRWPNIRRVGSDMEALTAAFCAPESTRHSSGELIGPMEKIRRRARKHQPWAHPTWLTVLRCVRTESASTSWALRLFKEN